MAHYRYEMVTRTAVNGHYAPGTVGDLGWLTPDAALAFAGELATGLSVGHCPVDWAPTAPVSGPNIDAAGRIRLSVFRRSEAVGWVDTLIEIRRVD